MIDARAAILQLRALISTGDFTDLPALRRLALRATSGIGDVDLAGRLQDELSYAIEMTAMLAEMNEVADTPAVFNEDPLKALDEIEAALTPRSRQE